MHIRDFKTEARERFALNRYHAMLIYGVVYTLALNIAILTTVLALINKWAIWYGIVLIFLFLLMLAPFGFGMTGFYLKLYRYEKTDAFHIFDGFNKYNLERVIILRLLKFALWLAFTVLLIVPGIIFSVRTSMATYLLRANPKLKPQDALKASNRIMKTHCFKYFGLMISFAGWFLMGVLTCGLGFIWVLPYINSAKIVFYKRELQGDKTVYNNPMDALQNTVSENKKLPQDAEETEIKITENEPEKIAFTIEKETPEEPNYPEQVIAEPVINEVKSVPAFRQAASELRKMDTIPLPGGRVFLDSNGRRVVDRRRPPEKQEQSEEQMQIEITESGEDKTSESVRERISRLRAERNASRGMVSNDNQRRRDSDKRRPHDENSNIEIGEH